ncbi:lipase [Corynebacterium casei]|uniref:lipase n=1 Tax=Corynebacterium casei TaxID=160386 RepID=UPI003F935E6B
MPENTPESQKHVLSNLERVERAEQSTQNSFEQYSGSKTTDRWMWIVGVVVVVFAVAAALFAWIRSNAEPNAQPVVDRAVVDVDSSAPVEILNGGYVGTFAGEFNASPENTWDGVISFAGETAVLVYPTTGCQALLTLMETDGAEEGVAAYDTQALNNKCVTDGFWKFEEDSGQISAQYFETNEAGDEELKAAATLTRDIDELVVAPE